MVEFRASPKETLSHGLSTINSWRVGADSICHHVIVDPGNVGHGIGGSVALKQVAVAGSWHESVLSGVLEGSFDNSSALPSKVWSHVVVVDGTRRVDPGGTIGQEFKFVHGERGKL